MRVSMYSTRYSLKYMGSTVSKRRLSEESVDLVKRKRLSFLHHDHEEKDKSFNITKEGKVCYYPIIHIDLFAFVSLSCRIRTNARCKSFNP